ncbi:MAG: histidinol-phosphate aminotransferase family protein [Dehalococcoidia bacterium]|nr:histidinol-phosphate aminotransferase family protein [Dehalococcoidia bacterium]MYA53323.1 histidinol-phosphate aminotransferase family protein [Dehalococcoidia bacterium]
MGNARTVHGGLDAGELRSLGLVPEQVLDFSANINPLGPSKRVREAAAAADLAAYPDRESFALRQALASRLGVAGENLVVGNGSTELIHLLARSRLRPGDACLIFSPTFGEYEAAALGAGAVVHSFPATEADAFHWSIDAAVRAVDERRPAAVFLCNPNNPTGVHLGREAVERLAAAVAPNALLVLDDAYAPLADCPRDSLPLLGRGNVAILRSMTKDHALAGVRLGYLVAQPKVVAGVRALQHPWSVNAVAQAAGLAALDDDDHVEAARGVIREAKAFLRAELDALGLAVTPSAANFLLVKVGDGAGIRAALLRRRVAVRDCASFGLPEHIRIAVRRPEECARLVEALKEVLARA